MSMLRLIGSRWTARLLWLAFIALAGLVLIDALSVQRAGSQAQAVAAARAGEPLADSAGAAEKVARAVWLSSQDESEQALLLYQDVETADHGALVTGVAQFNTANQYLRDARRLMKTESAGRAVPLIELAKQIYRSLLIKEPDNWAVRYNLTRALTLLPDPPPDDEATAPRPDAERAITTMRGYSPGMP